MTAQQVLLQRLADGRFHSGQQLAADLGLSRAAVWKHVRRLQADWGVPIDAVRGRGYRLPGGFEPLDEDAISGGLSKRASKCLDALTILTVVDSTNRVARESAPTQTGCARVWLAEHQTAGRGRRGRPWHSAFGGNLYFSFAWRFDLAMSELAGLSLVSGVVLAELLRDHGLAGHTLKWPNDLLHNQRKLAGILLEVSGEADGPATAVIGIGLNMRVPTDRGRQIDQPWTDLVRAGAGNMSRNGLVAGLVERLTDACQLYQASQLPPFLARWSMFDGLLDRPVQLLAGGTARQGIYRGISASGGMILENASGRSEHRAGEVSLRSVTAT
ncbi:MAG: biotin--[acetyl-CoA-carboxylase] ligase [Gammaproteobacteria bacterium]|nr:biotin--[acetyl-CoA-carboxylase] ligase [Gammaproteobacteria bacterium]